LFGSRASGPASCPTRGALATTPPTLYRRRIREGRSADESNRAPRSRRMTEEPLDLERLRAFVRGELDDAARASVEALLDRRPDARRVLGVLAREGGRATDRDPYVGALLGGRYRIEHRLGAGGMGAVYAAEHE